MHVEASTEMLRDGGSIPPASTSEEKAGIGKKSADSGLFASSPQPSLRSALPLDIQRG